MANHTVFGSKWLQARDDLKDEMYSGKSGSKEKLVNPKEFEKAGTNLCEKIEETDESLLSKILDSLPESWQITDEEKKAVIEYLMYRKSKLKDLFIGHLNFSR